MPAEPDDPRLADFTALNDPATRRQVERHGGYFVVEGILAIERLLGRSDWEIRTLVLLPRVAERLASAISSSPSAAGVPVVVTDEDRLRSVVGFDLHRGALASVTRRPIGPPPAGDWAGTDLVLVAEGVNDHENLGALYRNAAAFGARAVVLDPTCADPFYRRSVRVSQGHVLSLRTYRSAPFPAGLADLHGGGMTTVALTPGGDTDLRDLDRDVLGPGPVALLVGAEGPGLSPGALAAAHHRVSISMHGDVDSLNVATAAAVALHHLSR